MRVITYPLAQLRRGFRHQVQLNAQAKQLAYFYDIAKRLGSAHGLPRKLAGRLTYQVIGEQLALEAEQRGLALKGASLTGLAEEVIAAIEGAWPQELPSPSLAKDQLAALRILAPVNKPPLKERTLRSLYDTFVPIKSARALDVLIKREGESAGSDLILEDKLFHLEKERDRLLGSAREKIRYLDLGHQAYVEIMSAIYRRSSSADLMINITSMFDVVTKWAYQVIGRSPGSEAAGWIAVGPDGKVGVPYRFLAALPGQKLEDIPLFTLCRPGSRRGHSMAMDDLQTVIEVADKRGRYISVEEWENLRLREDLVVVEDKGQRKLYRRHLRPGSELVRHMTQGLVGQKIGKGLGKAAGVFAGALTEVVGKIKSYDNAFVELEEIDLASVDLTEGHVIPFVEKGTVITLVSAGSNNPNLRDEKIRKGQGVETVAEAGGLKVGIVNQRLEAAIGNVRTSALKPLAYMIEDANVFNVRPQNRFLISIVGVASYFIRSLMEFNERGEAICLGCLEVTNPDVIPQRLSDAEKEQLQSQFLAGKVFANLASTGIMIKVLQEEINNLTRSYLGEKVYQVVRDRDFAKLRGVKIDDASIMFADVSGFTALSDILKDQPDKVVYLLSHLFSRLDPIVVRNGGMVDKHDGDCIMADFGVPDRVPGDVESSVTAAIGLQRELQQINLMPEMRQMYQEHDIKPLGMTIGVNTGMIIAGNLGHEGSKIEYSVIGDAVNQAARLQHAVVRGHILIGERTYKLLSQEYRQRLIDEFNAYNRDIADIRRFVLAEYQREGKAIDEVELDAQLDRYLKLYQDATETDMFVPSVIWAKNKGVLASYYVRWDRHAFRYDFLRQAGIEFADRANFENQPQSIGDTIAAITREPNEARRNALHLAYTELLNRHGL